MAIRQPFLLLAGVAIAGAITLLPPTASADDPQPLTEATVDRLQNTVTVELQQEPIRYARVDDLLVPEDKLNTGAQSLAQMIFNDESLLRVGQHSVFQFLPSERQILLDRGVMMMVTPPGAGGAEIATPTAIAGVQGSLATFLSEQQGGDDILEAATFTSELILYNRSRVEIGRLQPGELGIVRNGVLESVQQFDRCNVLQDNPLLAGLHPEDSSIDDESEAAAATLQQERDLLDSQGACDPDREIVANPEPPVTLSPICQQIVDLYTNNVRSYGSGSWQPRGAEVPPGSGRFRTELVYDLLKGGTVDNVRVVQSSGYEPLDRSAIAHVQSLTGFPEFPSCYPGDTLEVDHGFTLLVGP
ncbi:MAG: TonB family protein [Cyanobacteria bacterium P01_E01_bin.34]